MDPRLELADLAAAANSALVLEALDGVRVIVEAPAERIQSRHDQVAVFTIVNLAARLFPHLELRLGGEAPSALEPLLGGQLGSGLGALAELLAPEPSQAPSEDFHLSFGQACSSPGLSGNASGWSFSVGPEQIALAPSAGPAVGSVACGCFLVSQLFATRMAPLGLPVSLTTGFAANLLDYRNQPAPELAQTGPLRLGPMALLGCGSVGSSTLAAALLIGAEGGPVDLVDPDAFSARNVLRYPILREQVDGPKAQWLAERAGEGGLEAEGRVGDIQDFLAGFPEPPAIDLAAVSVDTIEGRRDATDLLARRTLNVGVAGLALHISSHEFSEQSGCAYCQYVDVAPSLSGAAQLAEMIGLGVERVVAIELGGGRISEADAAAMAAAGRFGDQPPQAGERLADLRRRIYAQAAVPAADGEGQVLISAPFVSQMAGLLMVVEALKESTPELAGFRLRGRYDLDLSGQPADYIRALQRDKSGRCLCFSPFRRRAHERLHSGTQAA